MTQPSLRRQCESRLDGLRLDRYSWWLHWRELADYILPRRYKWLLTPNQASRGSPINARILDSTGTLALRNLASGMMSGITSPSRPWFKLRIPGVDTDVSGPVAVWLAECERRVMRVFAESNFYAAMATCYLDLALFGTAPVLIYEDYDDVIRCFNPCAGEYFIAINDQYRVDTIYREFVLTISQVVRWFGVEKCSDAVRKAYVAGGVEATREIRIGHAIEPNDQRWPGSPSEKFSFREVYWEIGVEWNDTLSVKGFYEWPGMCPRWDLVSNDPYGRSPAMDALPDIKQLQLEQKRKAQAIDKMVNPPMIADVQLRNQPASLLPGGVTYLSGASTTGFKPIYQVIPPIAELKQDIAEVQQRVKTTFFNDLFFAITQLETVRTATDINARIQEKLVMLGPVLERFENEALDPAIDRVFAIMTRAGLIPPAPPEIHGAPLNVQYVSLVSEAQRSAATAAIEQVFAITGNLAGIDPTIMDVVDDVDGLNEYASLLSAPPKMMRSPGDVAAIRANRAKQQAAQQAMQASLATAQGAQVLSKTNVGGGQNALQAMIGGATP